MAIARVDFPTVPNPVAGDWALLTELVSKSFKNINNPLQAISGNIPQGSLFQVGDVIYYANADYAITGTSSNYVKLTPTVSGDELNAAYVSSLTGVSWNKIYNGYYDVSGNLYVFDEAKAIYANILAVSYTRLLADPIFNAVTAKTLALSNNANIGGTLGVTGAANIGGTLGVTGAATIGGALACPTINTGLGAFEIGQNLRTTDTVEFANITKASNPVASVYTDDFVNYTVYPIGSVVLVNTGGTYPARNSAYAIHLYGTSGGQYTLSTDPNAGAQLSGIWRARGYTGDYAHMFQRTA